MIIISLQTVKAEILKNAKWIGVPGNELPFNSRYLSVFDIEFDLEISDNDSVSFIYGMNDPRLLHSNENPFNLSNPMDSSYIELRFKGTEGIEIYRKGYHPKDSSSYFSKFDCTLFKNRINKIQIQSNSGITTLYINGEKVGETVLNPFGRGGDYLAFPVLADLGIKINENSNSQIGNIRIKNYREPQNTIYNINEWTDKSKVFSLPVRSMPELRTILNIQDEKEVESAEMKATSRGIYDIYVNGERVTNDYFYPGFTQYNKTHLYHLFDLKPYLHSGDNEILISLGEGWWSGSATYTTENWNFFGDRQSFLAEINLNFADGKNETIVTNPENWEYNVDGPVLEASFFNGEVYDNSRNLTERNWIPAVEISLDTTVNKTIGNWKNINFRPTFGDRVIAIDTLFAKQFLEPRKGVYIYDMGQNFAGVPFIEFSNLDPGQEINFRYAEMLYPDMPQYRPNVGMIMTENLRAAMNKDVYIASGSGNETFSPRKTLHGYRYIEITGIDQPLALQQVKGIPLSSVHKINAHYESSNPLVNRLWENIVWSTRSNFISIPTDCPQRNERLGWMGDISVYSPTATKLADISPLIRQYLTSIRDCQLPNGKYPDVAPTGTGFGGLLWGSAGIIVPWENYLQYKDFDSLKEHYPSMKRYIDYVLKETIDPATGIIFQNHDWGDLGDWLSPEYEKNDKSLLWECYFIYDLQIMAKVAELMNKKEDAEFYNNLRNSRIEFFKDNYIDKETEKTIWSDYEPSRKGEFVDTQVSYVLPIAFGIYESPHFINNFKQTISRENKDDNGNICPPYSLMTGFIGTAWISEALSKIRENEIAYKLLTNISYPSWLYPVTQGATTIWERLNSYTHKEGFGQNNNMNSFNHYSFGSVGNWLITRSLGIDVDSEGGIEITPQPDNAGNITWAKGWREIEEGRIESSWKIDNDKITFEISLPGDKNGFLNYKGERIKLHSGKQNFSFTL